MSSMRGRWRAAGDGAEEAGEGGWGEGWGGNVEEKAARERK